MDVGTSAFVSLRNKRISAFVEERFEAGAPVAGSVDLVEPEFRWQARPRATGSLVIV